MSGGVDRHRAGVWRPGGVWAVAAAILLAGCIERSRPSPVEPAFGLSVEVVSPQDGGSVYPGYVDVTVHGHDVLGQLNSLGALVERAEGDVLFVDSVATEFDATDDRTMVIRVNMPRDVSAPVGVKVWGLATNVSGGEARSTVRTLLVIPCPLSGCPDSTAAAASRSRGTRAGVAFVDRADGADGDTAH